MKHESDAVDAFQLALRVLANPKDRLHLAALAKKWKVGDPALSDFHGGLAAMAGASPDPHARAVQAAIDVIAKNPARLDLMPAFNALQKHADALDEAQRLAIYEDIAVFRKDWDQFLRSTVGAKTLGAFISSKALGSTQKSSRGGVALLTVHSSKGLEFDVVFIAGMAEGTFPDYRAAGAKGTSRRVPQCVCGSNTLQAATLSQLSEDSRHALGWHSTTRPFPISGRGTKLARNTGGRASHFITLLFAQPKGSFDRDAKHRCVARDCYCQIYCQIRGFEGIAGTKVAEKSVIY